MEKGKNLKLETIKKSNPELHKKVLSGEITVTDAYNETKRIQLGLNEFRGTNTKKKEFATDFKRMMALHDPTQEELINENQESFPVDLEDVHQGRLNFEFILEMVLSLFIYPVYLGKFM